MDHDHETTTPGTEHMEMEEKESDSEPDSDDDWDFFDSEDMDVPSPTSLKNGMHPLLESDIQKFSKTHGHPKDGDFLTCPFLTHRLFESLGDLDLDIHIPLPFLNISQQLAEAWKINWKYPLSIHLALDSHCYLDCDSPPKVEVYQLPDLVTTEQNIYILNHSTCGISAQLKNILRAFLVKLWNDPQWIESKTISSRLIHSGSESAQAAAFESLDQNTSCAASSSSVPQSEVRVQRRKKRRVSVEKVVEQVVEPPAAGPPEPPRVISLPTMDNGFIDMLFQYVCQRVPYLNEFCVICDSPHVAAMLMPSVCEKDLCIFGQQTLGVMGDVDVEISSRGEVVDLLIQMAKRACSSARQNIILVPYPNIVDPGDAQKLALSEKAKDFPLLSSLLEKIPTGYDLRTLDGNLQTRLKNENALLCPLLRWIIYSNLSHIVKLPAEKQLEFMCTDKQFLLLSSPPAVENRFQRLKAKYGSVFAFHGSSSENWHSIVRRGLLVASGTDLQVNGAAHGKGIYLSPQAEFSLGYSSLHVPNVSYRPSSASTAGTFRNCLALCEVIPSSALKKHGCHIWTLNQADHVVTRFFFVFDSVSKDLRSVNMNTEKYLDLVRTALDSCYHPLREGRGASQPSAGSKS